jgi:hypothetical protein
MGCYRDYYRQVNHVAIEGPMITTKWSHMTITFSAEYINLAYFPHTCVMVVTVHIDRWDVTKILVDNGSQAEVLFLLAFEKMGYERRRPKEPTKSLYGFGRKRIELVRVITLPISLQSKESKNIIYHLRCRRHTLLVQHNLLKRIIEYL